LNPFNMSYLNQPISASADMFQYWFVLQYGRDSRTSNRREREIHVALTIKLKKLSLKSC
jgi:hypothetical protein